MKHITSFIIVAFWIITSLHSQAQNIVAGQTSGANIIYNDIEDVEVSSSFWWDDNYESLDLNDDGVNDLTLLIDWIYYSNTNSDYVYARGNPLGGLQYSSLSDNPIWIKKHNAGEVINNSLNFHAENGLFFSEASSKSTAGNFSGEGYLAYRICNPDTLYGWLRIMCDVSFSGAYLTAYEYAYVINTIGLPQEMDITFGQIIRKSGNCLLINLPECQFSGAYHLYGFDVTGRQVFQSDLMPGNHSLIISGYPHGLYILRMVDIDGRTFSGKMIF